MKIHILSELLNKEGMGHVKVQSVTASQGAECDFAVLSTVAAPADTSSATVRRYVATGTTQKRRADRKRKEEESEKNGEGDKSQDRTTYR